MSDQDPFAEPDDTDKTVIRPNPGGRRNSGGFGAAPAAPMAPNVPEPQAADTFGVAHGAAPRPQAASGNEVSAASAVTGMNQLTASASTLFSLISRIRNRAQHMDPEKLRQSVVAEVRAFENRALQAGIPAQTVKVARYAMCATMDDVVLNTPWGSQSNWGLQSMVGTFHRETVGGDRFYDLLARLEKDPGNNIEMLEFLYMCLSLGFEGRLRVEQGGSEKHLQIRNGLARVIRAQRGPLEWDLSPHWEGIKKPFKALSFWKVVWISLAATLALLVLQFVGLSWFLSNNTERLVGQLSIIDIGPPAEFERPAPPPPPPPPPPTVEQQIDKVIGFLQPEIDEGIVEVFQKGNTLVIRLTGSGMFEVGSDQLAEKFVTPVNRVAKALNDEPGPVIIVGHTDSTGKFSSNMALSLARAKSVMRGMSKEMDDSERLSAEGQADKDPVGDNGTREGRAKNRRIEVMLVQEEKER
ncbi:MAG: type IVB secretion system protein IcmH/DotU [Paracoccaceae bacterium]